MRRGGFSLVGLGLLASACAGSFRPDDGGEPVSGPDHYDVTLTVEAAEGARLEAGEGGSYPGQVHFLPDPDDPARVVTGWWVDTTPFTVPDLVRLPVVSGDDPFVRVERARLAPGESGALFLPVPSAAEPCSPASAVRPRYLSLASVVLRRLDDDGDGSADRLRGEGEGTLVFPLGREDEVAVPVTVVVEGRPDVTPPRLVFVREVSPTGDDVDPVRGVALRASELLSETPEPRVAGGDEATVTWGRGSLRGSVFGLDWDRAYEVRLPGFRDLAGNPGPDPAIRFRTAARGALRARPLGFEPGEDLVGFRALEGEPELVTGGALPVPSGDGALLLRAGDRVRVALAVPPGARTLRARTRRLLSPGGDPNVRPDVAGFTVPPEPGSSATLVQDADDFAGFRREDTDDPRWPTALGVRDWSSDLGGDFDADEIVLEVSLGRRCDASDADAVLLDDVRVE